MIKLIDLHNHVISGVDDGAENIEETMAILSLMEKNGVKKITATPHYPLFNDQGFKKEIKEKIAIIKEEIVKNNLKIEIAAGTEIMITKKLPKLYYQNKVLTLNNTDYILLEFRLNIYPDYLAEIVHDLKTMGLKIIIAHPERYRYLQSDYKKAYQWLQEYDLKLMLNSSSLIGSHGSKAKATAQKLLQLGLCHLMASDTHGLKKRPFTLQQGLKEAEKIKKGSAKILKANAEAVFNNQKLNSFEIKREEKSLVEKIFSFF